jgi:Na+/glutamate symporter
MAINVPELERVPAEQRQALIEEAIRTVKATHGKMSNVLHYFGCALAAAIILPLAVMNKGSLMAVLAGVPAYALCLVVGVVLWRRSMVRELRVVVSRIIAARPGA